jgi:hypothetical protein
MTRELGADVKRPTTALDSLIALGIFLLGFAYLYLFHRLGWFMQDEGELYYPFLRTLKGQLPYRDFFTGYPPMIYYINALLFRHFEVSIPTARIFMGLLNASTAAMLFVVARRLAPRGFALVPGLLFLVMQPGEITNLVFQNAPYPSWYAMNLYVLTLWGVLRSLEARGSIRQGAWLLAAGFLAGLSFLSKQNAGIFLLWAVSGFLAACPPDGKGAQGGERLEPAGLRILRLGYLALIPIAAMFLIRSFLSPLTLALFVAPTVALGALGARQRFTSAAGRSLLARLLLVGAGFCVAFLPWLIYFGQRVGYGHFLRELLFLGQNVEQNLFVPFPQIHLLTGLILGPALLILVIPFILRPFVGNARSREGPRFGGGSLWLVLVGTLGLLAALLVSRSPLAMDLVRLQLGPGEIYLAVSRVLDNVAAYGSVLVLAGGILVAWRHAAGRIREDDPPPRAFLWILWGAACAYILYYPRMDSAHLYVGAAPVLYLVGISLLPRARARATEALSVLNRRTARRAFNIACAAIFAFAITSRTMPKLYSKFMVKKTESGFTIGPTDVEWLDLPRTGIYFPIYYEEQRLPVIHFRTLVRYIQSQTSESDPIFAFPALSMVYFASGRDNPTRHDYFFGNNVSFYDQIETIRILEERRVPMAILFNNPAEYFTLKGQDFTHLIREYLGHRYYLDRRIGSFDVLQRYDAGEARPSSAPENPAF